MSSDQTETYLPDIIVNNLKDDIKESWIADDKLKKI